MCGIIVVVSEQATETLIEGLSRLEYRGYGSSGVSLLAHNKIATVKVRGGLINLTNKLQEKPLQGPYGIGHTRWATHGQANQQNAHPHKCGNVSVIHNGIIENYLTLKDRLIRTGHRFSSETDSEVVAHLINHYLSFDLSYEKAISRALADLEGSYALGILIAGDQNQLFSVKNESPLVISEGNEGLYIASDVLALGADVTEIYYPKNKELICLGKNGIRLCNNNHKSNKKSAEIHDLKNKDQNITVNKESYTSFIEIEIKEQVSLFKSSYFNTASEDFSGIKFKKITIVACGTSFYATSVKKYWIEKYAHINVEVDIASEYRYRSPIIHKNELAIFVSQSSKTADTLAALHYAINKKCQTMGLVNVATSTIAREVDFMHEIHASPEIGVASTKVFICQLAIFYKMMLAAVEQRMTPDSKELYQLKMNFFKLPHLVNEIIKRSLAIKSLAECLVSYDNMLFIGRGTLAPIASEGGLKLKEVSYLHAEAYDAGELKNEPVALLDETMPVVAIAPKNELTKKLISNIQEVKARCAPLFIIGDKEVCKHFDLAKNHIFELSDIPESIALIISVIPLQLLALYCGQLKGNNVDQPRNLVKSVTVE
jgi:glucosamine--fructose-6-phosphate aminotransferase (isomerizing)